VISSLSGKARSIAARRLFRHLRHGKERALADDAMRAIDREAAAAAHANAVDQRHIGLGDAVEALNEAIFLVEEICLVVAGALRLAARVKDRAQIAVGAKGALAGAPHQERLHPVVLTTGDELRIERPVHGQRQGVERFWAVQRNDAEGAAALEQHIVGIRHGPRLDWARSRRAIMTRMISLVPSRI
jgi:hypothetical protein